MSTSPFLIRPATPSDAATISEVVARSLRTSNASDYPPSVVEAVVAGYSAERIAELMAVRRTLVALESDIVVGTVSLEGAEVQSLFVSPERQGGGIGASLMKAAEALARADGLDVLRLASSVTAEPFHRKLGYAPQGEKHGPGGRLILLEKRLDPA
jgi:predicted N-acetyltransferase YhbS